MAAPVPKGPDDAGAGRSLSREHILCIEKTFYIVKPSPSAWAPRFARRMSLRGGAAAPPRIGVLGSPPPDDFEDARKYYGAEHIGDHLSQVCALEKKKTWFGNRAESRGWIRRRRRVERGGATTWGARRQGRRNGAAANPAPHTAAA